MPVTTTHENKAFIPTEPQPGDGEVVGELRTRGAFRDRPILYVLLVSLALVVIGFGIAFMTMNNQEAAADQGMAQTTEPGVAATFDTPAAAPVVGPSN